MQLEGEVNEDQVKLMTVVIREGDRTKAGKGKLEKKHTKKSTFKLKQETN